MQGPFSVKMKETYVSSHGFERLNLNVFYSKSFEKRSFFFSSFVSFLPFVSLDMFNFCSHHRNSIASLSRSRVCPAMIRS